MRSRARWSSWAYRASVSTPSGSTWCEEGLADATRPDDPTRMADRRPAGARVPRLRRGPELIPRLVDRVVLRFAYASGRSGLPAWSAGRTTSILSGGGAWGWAGL